MQLLPIEYHTILSGTLATSVLLLIGERVAMSISGARSPLATVGKAIILLAPGALVDVTVALVENFDKPIIRTFVIGLFLGVGVLMGMFGLEHAWLGYGLLSLLGIVAVLAGIIDPVEPKWPTMVAIVMGTMLATIVWFLLQTYPLTELLICGWMIAGILLWSIVRTKARQKKQPTFLKLPVAVHPLPPIPANCKFKIKGLQPFVTSHEKLYVADTAFPTPAIDHNNWRLRVFGLVDHEYELSWQDMAKMPLMEMDSVLICVHNPVGGHRIGNARWLGLPLTTLMEKAGIHSDAGQIVATSEDGFSVIIPLYLLDKPWQAMVAIGMNGNALSHQHGFPARLLVPGIYGFSANIKWLTNLEVAPLGDHGFWEKRGWAEHPALVQPQCRIDTPAEEGTILNKRTWIAGTAWAPPFGIQAVEVAIDNGPWQTAEIAEELTPLSWRQWRLKWQATPGQHTLMVRTTGRQGTQVETSAPPYPGGATGIHTVNVTVLPPFSTLTKGSMLRHMRHQIHEGKKRILLAKAGVQSWLRKV